MRRIWRVNRWRGPPKCMALSIPPKPGKGGGWVGGWGIGGFDKPDWTQSYFCLRLKLQKMPQSKSLGGGGGGREFRRVKNGKDTGFWLSSFFNSNPLFSFQYLPYFSDSFSSLCTCLCKLMRHGVEPMKTTIKKRGSLPIYSIYETERFQCWRTKSIIWQFGEECTCEYILQHCYARILTIIYFVFFWAYIQDQLQQL